MAATKFQPTQTYATMAAQTLPPGTKKVGQQKGCEKPKGSGRPKGGRNSAVVEREKMMVDAIKNVFSGLTEAEITDITALRVMQLCMVAVVRSGQFGLALMSAEKLAPYTHAKLAPRVIDDADANTVRIVGGLPETSEHAYTH